jgi:5-methylcytosine-specific restriction protein A
MAQELMPTRAKHPCHQPGCNRIIRTGTYCDEHRKTQATLRRERDPELAFYKTNQWRRFRAWFIARHPLCVRCLANQRLVPTEQVHHKKPRRTHPELAFDEENCEALCHGCHSRETMRERYKS